MCIAPTNGAPTLSLHVDPARRRVLVVPGAGLGTRLQSSVPKPLIPVNGIPMLDRLFDLYRGTVSRVVVVVRPSVVAAVRAHVSTLRMPADVQVQVEPTGMLDAILAARDCVAATDAARVWITWCDQVAIDRLTVRRLAECEAQHPTAPLILPTRRRHRPYTHLERNADGRVVRILHRRENDVLPDPGESEMGLFSLSREGFLDRLTAFAAAPEIGAATGERNFLPFIPWLAARADVITVPGTDDLETVGVNTSEELDAVEAHLAIRAPSARLSVIIPAYNEERFIGTLLERIKAVNLSSLGIEKEIIVVDDCSQDRTFEIASQVPGIRVKRLQSNGGKGGAVRAGIDMASGDYLIIQDADLEYDPNDYLPMLRALISGEGDVVYGSRYLTRGKHRLQSWPAYLGGRSLSLIALAFNGKYLTDTVTALKLFHREDVASLPLETSGFELDHEITGRMLARRARIAEVPVSYMPRSRAEGKKIGLRDWFIGARTFWRYRHG
jgi:dolichol-phosphate mannosyltransferase